MIDSAFAKGLLQCFPSSDVPTPPATIAFFLPLTPARVVILAREIHLQLREKGEDATLVRLSECMSEVQEDAQIWEVLPEEKFGQSTGKLHLSEFTRFIDVLAEFMKVEQQVIVSFLVWVQKGHFELVDSQCASLCSAAFRWRPREHKDGELRLDAHDFEILMRRANVITPTGAQGMSSDKCHTAFTKFLENVNARMKARMESRPLLVHHAHVHHDHFTAQRHESRGGGGAGGGGASLVGRTEMSEFLFELWNDPSNHLQKMFVTPSALASALASAIAGMSA